MITHSLQNIINTPWVWDAEEAGGASGEVEGSLPSLVSGRPGNKMGQREMAAGPKSLGSFRVGTGAVVTELTVRAVVV